jgi:hypothetical protein
MSSEWMKVMLDEIARKKDEEAEARLELERRLKEGARAPEPPSDSPGVATPGVATPGVATPGVGTPPR